MTEEFPSESPSEPGFFRRVFDYARVAVIGLRTLATCAAVAVAGLADQFELVDIIGWIQSIFGYGARIGSVLVTLAVVFFTLRTLSKGPAKLPRRKKRVDEPVSERES